MFDSYVNFADEVKATPKCLLFDNESCDFSNGDTLYVDNCYPHGNGYVLELTWYDHESQEAWSGITLLMTQGHIYEVTYLSIDTDADGCEYVDECFINTAHMVGTPLYMYPVEEWKSLYMACSHWF